MLNVRAINGEVQILACDGAADPLTISDDTVHALIGALTKAKRVAAEQRTAPTFDIRLHPGLSGDRDADEAPRR